MPSRTPENDPFRKYRLIAIRKYILGFYKQSGSEKIIPRSWQFLSSYLPKMDHRIGVFMLKLVCAENFMLFGLSDRELSYFQNLAFPILSWNLLL